MKKYLYIIGINMLIFVSSCSVSGAVNSSSHNSELLEFAKVNCMFWYFKKKNYPTDEIRAISGGIVELGSYSAEKYKRVAFMVKEYKPSIKTKQNIDIDLIKCFKMESDSEFMLKINNLK